MTPLNDGGIVGHEPQRPDPKDSMTDILISVPHPQTKADLEALWLGMPESTRNKIEKLPPGIRNSLLEVTQSYALSAYKLGGIRQRRKCHEALTKIANVVHPDGNLDAFLNPVYGPQA